MYIIIYVCITYKLKNRSSKKKLRVAFTNSIQSMNLIWKNITINILQTKTIECFQDFRLQ